MTDANECKNSQDQRNEVLKDQKTDNTGTNKNEYFDVLNTEECFDTTNVVRGYN